jgi:hypothetical protein
MFNDRCSAPSCGTGCPRVSMSGLLLPALVIFIVSPCVAASQSSRDRVEQPPALIEIQEVTPGAVQAMAFTLTSTQQVRVEAAGADVESARRIASRRNIIGRLVMSLARSGDRFDDDVWPANAWILDAKSREVVWELRRSGRQRERDGLLHFEGDIELPKGTYEAYYAFFPLDRFFNRDGWSWFHRDDAKVYINLGLRVFGEGQALEVLTTPAEADPGTIMAFHRLGDNASERIGFELDRAAEVEIRAIGEARASTTYDYGWLMNADTRERIWELTYADSEPAGGAEKNRLSRVRLRLPAGRYAAFFLTDDSHSPAAWNAPPPHDPFRYGLSIRLVNPAAKVNVRSFEYQPVPRDQAIVAITGVGDNQYRSEGFTLKRPLGVRIFALGEGTRRAFVDYAWISNAATGERVWEMEHDRTEHAGGGAKNRLFDGTIRLEPGDYIVHYVTDDSHSAESWNDAPPADRDYWGVTVLPASGKLDRSLVRAYDPEADGAVIARLVGMRDNQVSRRRFQIERDAGVRIYALGEGVGEQMVDYAYITNARNGRRVWEMRYEDTEHAGGAEKNRVFDGAIRLAAGEYELVYRTDDSHAFGSWNAARPRDFPSWGVTVYRVR